MTQASSLRSFVDGEVFAAGDDGYAEAAQSWDRSVPTRAPLVLVAASANDIAVGARWADENGYAVSIRNTGHGAFTAAEDALLISVAKLRSVEIDVERRRATVAAGTRWSDVTAAIAPHQLMHAGGSSPGVGVIGYTLGGGVGPLGRSLGFAADRVTALTVLDADYQAVRLTPSDGDAFWALRGAGGLGIVTELEFDLAPIPRLFGGGIYFSGDNARELLSAYAGWVEGHDERTSTSIALLHLPPAPELPPQLRGRYVVHLRFAHVDTSTADLEGDARSILAPMLNAAAVIDDGTRIMSVADLPEIHRDPVPPMAVAYRGGFVDTIDEAAIGSIIEAMSPDRDEVPRAIELRHLGGAYSRSPIAPSSVTGREAHFSLYVTTVVADGAAAEARALVNRTVPTITSVKGAQLNFYGPAPAVGEILEMWSDEDARRIVAVAESLDPRGRIRTGRPVR